MVQYSGVADKGPGVPIDFYFNTWSQLFYVSTLHYESTGFFTAKGWVYTFNVPVVDSSNVLLCVDKVWSPVTPPNTGWSQTINVNIEIDSFVPDGSESKL